MKKSSVWTSRVGLGLVILIGAAAMSGCGSGNLPSEMKELPGGTKGDGNDIHRGQTSGGTPAPAPDQAK